MCWFQLYFLPKKKKTVSLSFLLDSRIIQTHVNFKENLHFIKFDLSKLIFTQDEHQIICNVYISSA